MTATTPLSPPEGRTRVGNEPFSFHCHPGVPCFLTCCRNVELLLFPYDIIMLKQSLGIDSATFLRAHTTVGPGSHPFFPGLQLRLKEVEGRPCPFLEAAGCGVYRNRPSACRTYPLERGVEHSGRGRSLTVHYFMTHHPYCLGHMESRPYTVKQWERDQALFTCNLYNDLWAELDAFFSTNPWAGEGKAGPLQQLAFMVCYNIDGFRSYSQERRLLDQFRLSKAERRHVASDDGELLKFGFAWLEQILGGRQRLAAK
jgi:uncharacterized protein